MPLMSVLRAALTIALATVLLWLAPFAAAQVAPASSELTLYGVRLKDAPLETLIAAVSAAGARRLEQRPNAPTSFDTREAGVPALQRLTLITDRSGLVSAQFVIKPYGQENEALRQALVQKYGLPTTADGARRLALGFDGRFAPRGSFDWDFAGGMKLIYRQPVIGDATLSYTDVEKAQRLALPGAARVDPPAGKGDVGNRF